MDSLVDKAEILMEIREVEAEQIDAGCDDRICCDCSDFWFCKFAEAIIALIRLLH